MKNSINLFLIAFFTAILPLPIAAQNEEASTKTVISSSGNKSTQRWRTSTGLTDFNIEFRGKIEISDDDKEIKGLSNDGYIEISKTVFGSKRKIIIESSGGGRINKEYYEGRTKKEWEPDGRQWLAEILPDIVRSTTLGAESRVNRFYRQGGSKSVLEEISSIKSDYVRAHYGKLLLGKNLSNQEMPEVITGLCNSIKSDYYLATLLKDNISKLLVTREAGDAFFKGTRNISSDYYKSVVLKEAVDIYATSPQQVKVILESASTISSDYYLSSVLASLVGQREVKDESLNELISVSTKISSDFYRAQVLNKVLEKGDLSTATNGKVADVASSISSDFYKSSVLTTLSEKSLDDGTLSKIITITGNSVNSDHYASSILKSVLKNQKLSDNAFQQLANTATSGNSDYYASVVLQEASSQSRTKTQLVTICKAVTNISSDQYKTSVLTSIAPQVKDGDGDLKEAYRQAAKNIRSETYYGRTLRAIE